MIAGRVESTLEPVVVLTARGPLGRVREVSCIVDTGYTGWLSLPSKLIEALELEWKRSDRAILADGSIIQYDCFAIELEWDGETRLIDVDEADSPPLLGTALLRGYELTAQMRPHGNLTLKKLPPKRRKRT